MTQQISSCILYKGDRDALRHCMAMLADISCEFIVIVSPEDRLKKADIDSGIKIPCRLVHVNGSLAQCLKHAVKRVSGKWVLLMHSNEAISEAGGETLAGLVHNGEPAYYVRSQKHLVFDDDRQMPDAFEWVGQIGKWRSFQAKKHNVFKCLEIRLFKRKLFDHMLIQHDGVMAPVFNKTLPSFPISTVEIERCCTPDTTDNGSDAMDPALDDYRRFVGETEEDLSTYADFEFLRPDNIGYSLLREKDLPGLAAGLDMGFGRVEILRFMLHALIKKGAFDKTIALADDITRKLGDHYEIWRLKGAAYFYRLDLENAEACYRRALTFKPDDPEAMFNLAKVLLIAKEFDQAKDLLLRLDHIETWSSEIAFILNSLSDRPQRTVRVSLLMLCKNEGQYLERALSSVKDVVDEIVVVDTGSTDKTRMIAEAFGAKVISHEWHFDFGAARNAGLEHMSGDYVLWMDADEFIDNETRIALLVIKNLLSIERPKGIVVNVETYKELQDTPNPVPPDQITVRTALFPLQQEVFFAREVFESVDDSLAAAGIDQLVAQNIRFFHISANTEQRKARKAKVLGQCTTSRLDAKDLIRGICFWLEYGDPRQAVDWFADLVETAGSNRQYDGSIAQLMEVLIQQNVLGTDSPGFEKLLANYSDSDEILSRCAHMLYRSGAYQEAAELFKTLLDHGNGSKPLQRNGSQQLKDQAYCAAANLETGHFARFDNILKSLLAQESMIDTCLALRFYSEVKKVDIEAGIGILDDWIKKRNITIKETIHSFVDLVRVINRFADVMTAFGQTDATHFLYRSAQHLSEKIIRNNHV